MLVATPAGVEVAAAVLLDEFMGVEAQAAARSRERAAAVRLITMSFSFCVFTRNGHRSRLRLARRHLDGEGNLASQFARGDSRCRRASATTHSRLFRRRYSSEVGGCCAGGGGVCGLLTL